MSFVPRTGCWQSRSSVWLDHKVLCAGARVLIHAADAVWLADGRVPTDGRSHDASIGRHGMRPGLGFGGGCHRIHRTLQSVSAAHGATAVVRASGTVPAAGQR